MGVSHTTELTGRTHKGTPNLDTTTLQGHRSWHSTDKQGLRGEAHVVQPPGGACSCGSACSLPADEEGHEEAVVLLGYAGAHHIAVVVKALLHGHQSASGATAPSCICHCAMRCARTHCIALAGFRSLCSCNRLLAAAVHGAEWNPQLFTELKILWPQQSA